MCKLQAIIPGQDQSKIVILVSSTEALFSIQILFVVDWNRFLDSLDINMRVRLESSSVQFDTTQRQCQTNNILTEVQKVSPNLIGSKIITEHLGNG